VGVTPSIQGDVLQRIEVLRGRAIRLWLRATVNGVPVRVVQWRAWGGELVALGPVGGRGDDPLVARWDTLPPPGGVWPLQVSLTIEAGGIRQDFAQEIAVAVRAPALGE
jgi:hypothetical protein